MKNHNKIIVASLSLMTSLSATAGLGGLNVQSNLGEPFSGSIVVTGSEAQALIRSGNVQIAGSNIQGSVVPQANGNALIRLRSSVVINEPLLNFLVKAGNQTRQYTAMINPANYRPSSTSRQAKAGTNRESRQAVASNTRAEEARRDVAVSKTSPNPRYYRTQAGDSISAIAARYRPRNMSLQRAIRALIAANPRAFHRQGNPRSMYRNVMLYIPSAAQWHAYADRGSSHQTPAKPRHTRRMPTVSPQIVPNDAALPVETPKTPPTPSTQPAPPAPPAVEKRVPETPPPAPEKRVPDTPPADVVASRPAKPAVEPVPEIASTPSEPAMQAASATQAASAPIAASDAMASEPVASAPVASAPKRAPVPVTPVVMEEEEEEIDLMQMGLMGGAALLVLGGGAYALQRRRKAVANDDADDGYSDDDEDDDTILFEEISHDGVANQADDAVGEEDDSWAQTDDEEAEAFGAVDDEFDEDVFIEEPATAAPAPNAAKPVTLAKPTSGFDLNSFEPDVASFAEESNHVADYEDEEWLLEEDDVDTNESTEFTASAATTNAPDDNVDVSLDEEFVVADETDDNAISLDSAEEDEFEWLAEVDNSPEQPAPAAVANAEPVAMNISNETFDIEPNVQPAVADVAMDFGTPELPQDFDVQAAMQQAAPAVADMAMDFGTPELPQDFDVQAAVQQAAPAVADMAMDFGATELPQDFDVQAAVQQAAPAVADVAMDFNVPDLPDLDDNILLVPEVADEVLSFDLPTQDIESPEFTVDNITPTTNIAAAMPTSTHEAAVAEVSDMLSDFGLDDIQLSAPEAVANVAEEPVFTVVEEQQPAPVAVSETPAPSAPVAPATPAWDTVAEHQPAPTNNAGFVSEAVGLAEPLEAKLELAKMYLEIDDAVAARETLRELLNEAQGDLQQQAQQLLNDLGG